jgi:ribosomal protein L20A (L18A)
MKEIESQKTSEKIPLLSKKLLYWIGSHHRVSFKEISIDSIEKKTKLNLRNIKRPYSHLIEIVYSHEDPSSEKQNYIDKVKNISKYFKKFKKTKNLKKTKKKLNKNKIEILKLKMDVLLESKRLQFTEKEKEKGSLYGFHGTALENVWSIISGKNFR